MYEIKGRDLYSQNGEGLYLEYIVHCIGLSRGVMFDIGSGDGFVLSNSRHLDNIGWEVWCFDSLIGRTVNVDNCLRLTDNPSMTWPKIISIDIDGNDYWILDKQLPFYKPAIVIAEFNPAYTNSRTIAYNPDHVWAGDSYYGFTFEAGVKLADKHGYKVIFQIADMNMIMVLADLIEGLYIPSIQYNESTFFKMSDRTDWVMV